MPTPDHDELRRLSEAVAFGQHAGQLVAVEQIVGPLERRLEPGRLADPLGDGDAGGQSEQPEDARFAVGRAFDRRADHGREIEPGVGRRVPAPAAAAAPGGLVSGDHHQAVRPAGIGQGRRPVHRRGHRRGVGDVGDVPAEPRPGRVDGVGERGGQRLGRQHGRIRPPAASISKLRSTAGAECVSAPADRTSAPAGASSARAFKRDPAGDLNPGPARPPLGRPGECHRC